MAATRIAETTEPLQDTDPWEHALDPLVLYSGPERFVLLVLGLAMVGLGVGLGREGQAGFVGLGIFLGAIGVLTLGAFLLLSSRTRVYLRADDHGLAARYGGAEKAYRWDEIDSFGVVQLGKLLRVGLRLRPHAPRQALEPAGEWDDTIGSYSMKASELAALLAERHGRATKEEAKASERPAK